MPGQPDCERPLLLQGLRRIVTIQFRQLDGVCALILKQNLLTQGYREAFNISKYLRKALDLKVWGFGCLFGLTTTHTYAVAYFLTII